MNLDVFSNFKIWHKLRVAACSPFFICFFLVILFQFFLSIFSEVERSYLWGASLLQYTLFLLPIAHLHFALRNIPSHACSQFRIIFIMSRWPAHIEKCCTKPDNDFYTIFKETFNCDCSEPVNCSELVKHSYVAFLHYKCLLPKW